MDKLNGTVSLKGRVAYVPQQAWIQNATIQENILFGQRMQGVKYSNTLHSCALEPDLDILPDGDQTEIGEKGINLSGGQKQRVSLARAVYQEADVYLLDDPLSAVDSHVGKHIFEKVIGPEGMIKDKTQLLVTHGINYLPQCDQIFVMSGGRISEVGSYAELIDADGAFAEFIRTYSGVGEDEDDAPNVSEYMEYDEENLALEQDDSHTLLNCISPGISDDPETRTRRQAHQKHLERTRSSDSMVKEKRERRRRVSKSDLQRQLSRQKSIEAMDKKGATPEPTARTALILQEKVETGSVHMSVVFSYIKSCTYPLSFLTVLLYLFSNGASLASNFWLADWSNSNIESNTTKHTTACDTLNSTADVSGCYLGVYGALGILQAVFVLFASFCLAMSAVFASRTLHNSMLKNILRSPMSFFDTTPLGRILNRFSKDIYIIDEVIPRSLRSFIFTFLTVVATLIVIVVTTPPFLVVIVPLLIFYGVVQRFYVATSRQLKRLESTTRSPIYSHFQESIMGVSSIRAYRVQDRFISESEGRVDYNQLAYYPSICSNRWLAIRLEFVGNLIILFAALFAVIQRNYQGEINIRINPGLVGLSISYALQVTQALNWVVRMTSEMETNIVAVERVKEYSETPSEAVAVIESHRPPPNWPAEGHVQFERYSTRYRNGLSLVLKDISVDIPGRTKVGIVGRTGAGKSSLTLALFRIIEAASGSVKIDNVPINTYGLSDLRSRLTIIPQDPVLFSGTLRVNLDPFDQYTDDEVWRALESAHLKNFVVTLTGGLQYAVSEGGENLSVGQRQLVCLARALLRKTKILVLDEATAAVDLETDGLIQNTIRTEFADCTILTIAHRINTIMDNDYVMLLDSGRIVEYSPPGELLSNKKSSFYAMAKDAGIVG